MSNGAKTGREPSFQPPAPDEAPRHGSAPRDSTGPDTGTAHPSCTRQRIPDAVWLLGALGIGVALRLFRLDEQSVWYDDYVVYVNVLESSFGQFWRAVFGTGSVNSEHVPLYFVLQFAWSRLAGDAPTTMRMLSVVTGIAAIPVVFLTGRYVFGSFAGRVAAFCMALSPSTSSTARRYGNIRWSSF